MTDTLPNELWVVVRSTGDYSDRVETPIRYCLSEADAERAVELTAIEAQRDIGLKPDYRRADSFGWQSPEGEWLDDSADLREILARGAKHTRLHNADEIEAQNSAWQREYEDACLALGHVDPRGSWTGDCYYCEQVTLWPAQGTEAKA